MPKDSLVPCMFGNTFNLPLEPLTSVKLAAKLEFFALFFFKSIDSRLRVIDSLIKTIDSYF